MVRATVVPMTRVILVQDESHAIELLRASRPDAREPELRELARSLAIGSALLVREEAFEVLDPAAPDEREPSFEPEPSPTPEPRPTVMTWFEACLVDLHGVPLGGIEVTWLCDGERLRRTSNAEGVVRLDDARSRSAGLWIPSAPALRIALTDAWSRASTTAPLTAGDDVEVVHYRDAPLGPIPLPPESRRTISIQPFVVLGRLLGMLFDTDRDFLLPISLTAIAELRDLYDRCEAKRVLVVGHTDTTAQPEYNEGLSRVRAESVKAYLTDDVDAWLARYEDSIGRWGSTEDLQMLSALPDWASRPPGRDPVRWFQETRGLIVDGGAGEQTRRALIGEYMARDGTTLPPGTVVDIHGCGEAFPLDATGLDVDGAPTDGAGDPVDRRVEVFFFGDTLGVLPRAQADSAYLSWRRRAQPSYEKIFGAQTLEIVLHDDDGRPIPHARYTVRLSLGTVIDGVLDDRGTARIERLPIGEVEIDFPDLDRGIAVLQQTPLKGSLG